jgi:hypothetical protein
LRHVQSQVAEPFSSLQGLCAGIAGDALQLLVAAAPAVAYLELSFGPRSSFTLYFGVLTTSSGEQQQLPPPPPPPAMIPLTSLPCLRSLHLAFPSGTVLARDNIAVLQQLSPQMLMLRISCYTRDDVRVDTFTDADLAALLERLPRLRQLSLGFVGQLTAAAFCIAGEACRELQAVFFPRMCFLWALEGARAQPLFPHLCFLNCRLPRSHPETSAFS